MCPKGSYWGFNSSKNVQKHQRGCWVFSLAVLYLILSSHYRKCHHNIQQNLGYEVMLLKAQTSYTTHAHHTPNTQAPATPHHASRREGYTHRDRETRATWLWGPLPCVSKMPNSPNACQVLENRVPSFCAAFHERPSRPQTGRGRVSPPLDRPAETAHARPRHALFSTIPAKALPKS